MTSANRMIGVDVGGTFTDIFVLDEATGSAQVAKVPTSRPCLLYTSPSPRDRG